MSAISKITNMKDAEVKDRDEISEKIAATNDAIELSSLLSWYAVHCYAAGVLGAALEAIEEEDHGSE